MTAILQPSFSNWFLNGDCYILIQISWRRIHGIHGAEANISNNDGRVYWRIYEHSTWMSWSHELIWFLILGLFHTVNFLEKSFVFVQSFRTLGQHWFGLWFGSLLSPIHGLSQWRLRFRVIHLDPIPWDNGLIPHPGLSRERGVHQSLSIFGISCTQRP